MSSPLYTFQDVAIRIGHDAPDMTLHLCNMNSCKCQTYEWGRSPGIISQACASDLFEYKYLYLLHRDMPELEEWICFHTKGDFMLAKFDILFHPLN